MFGFECYKLKAIPWLVVGCGCALLTDALELLPTPVVMQSAFLCPLMLQHVQLLGVRHASKDARRAEQSGPPKLHALCLLPGVSHHARRLRICFASLSMVLESCRLAASRCYSLWFSFLAKASGSLFPTCGNMWQQPRMALAKIGDSKEELAAGTALSAAGAQDVL